MTSVLKLDKRFNIFPNGSLQIRSVQKKDEAFYHCRAENPIGYNNVTAFMRVLGMYGATSRYFKLFSGSFKILVIWRETFK